VMAVADLSLKASFEKMQPLNRAVVTEGGEEGLERPGSEPTTAASKLAGRNGYRPNFLPGWNIPLPLATGTAANDMRKIRRGADAGKVDLKYRNFSVIMSKSRRLPMLTAVNIDAAKAVGAPRVDVWSFDGRLDEDDQWGDALYFDNPLDRGHMVRRQDPVWGESARQANVDTFHFTNACPQMAAVNQKTWLSLEDHILTNAKHDDMLVTVFTGPYFSDQDVIHRKTGALIPLAFWKVVAIVTDQGRPSATAYEVSQSRELEDLEFVFGRFKTFQISIQEVIDRTKLDFSGLAEFDGFSARERAGGGRLREQLESVEDIRI